MPVHGQRTPKQLALVPEEFSDIFNNGASSSKHPQRLNYGKIHIAQGLMPVVIG